LLESLCLRLPCRRELLLLRLLKLNQLLNVVRI
jgi:hypothetical protein